MKKVRETKVFLPGERRSVLAFTDLHFSKDFGPGRLAKILEIFRGVIQREKIEYVCFLGDLVDSLTVMDDAGLQQELCGFLEELGGILPVVMVFGNHDWSRYEGKAALIDKEGFRKMRRRLNLIPNVYLLGGDDEVFDDGKVRMVGVDLPAECYHFTNYRSEKSAGEAFRGKMAESLPKLETEGVREKYLLMHSSRFLREVEIPEDVVVLSGHMHDGVMPPVLDRVMGFSGRGLIGPGFSKGGGQQSHYEILPWNARLRPRVGRMWMSLRPVNYLPRDRKVGRLNRMFPEASYTVVRGGADKLRIVEGVYKF